MEYGCIGEKLGHSFSKEIHARIAPYRYELREIPRDELDAFLREKDFRAINVTIPYKQAVIPYLAHIDEKARAIGAVNVVINREGELWGYNTDYDGMHYLLTSLGISVEGKGVLILGTGGTSLTARALMRDLGAKTVQRVGRVAHDDAIDYEGAYQMADEIELIVNTTPVGMYPNCAGVPIDLSRFPHLAGVVDAVYHPLRTRLVTEALSRGIPAGGGLPMLVAQAVRAAELFLDTTFAPTLTDKVVHDITLEKENLILVGMPASGKSSVGRRLAERLKRPCIDLDDEIVRVAGEPISAIFAAQGEEAFRDLESKVLFETVHAHTGAVICTGGGAPLREENRVALHQTGRVYWLDRPLEALCPTADRPTASDTDAMRARYKERLPVYRAVSDKRIDGDGDVETVAERVYEEFCK